MKCLIRLVLPSHDFGVTGWLTKHMHGDADAGDI
jgi:hypothetical protein